MKLSLYMLDPAIVTEFGHGLMSLKLNKDSSNQISPVSVLPDRKVSKTISKSACFGIGALKNLVETHQIQQNQNPLRRGIFSSSPAPYTLDREGYFGPLKESLKDHGSELKRFGVEHRSCFPTIGVLGLPNGPMCYAADYVNAHGVHGSYVDGSCSTHQAIMAAQTHFNLGRMDDAFIFGFTQTNERFYQESLISYLHEIKEPSSALDGVCGGFSAYLSPNRNDVSRKPCAHLDECRVFSREEEFNAYLKESLRDDSFDLVLMSTLVASFQDRTSSVLSAHDFSGPVIDCFSQWNHFGEMAGLIEIKLAKNLADCGELAKNSRGLVICADLFGQISVLKFQLIDQLQVQSDKDRNGTHD